MIITSRNESETRLFGRELSKRLNSTDVVALYGDLGSGKTQLVKGICESLGVKNVVNSPTFIIVNEYSSDRIPKIFHFDFYRLKSVDEILNIGFQEYIRNGLCFIEWPELIESLLPENTIKIRLSHVGDDSTVRQIETESK